MKWFLQRRARPLASSKPPSFESEEHHTSLGLNTLFHRLRRDQTYNILDLGPACSDNLDFFSQFSGKIYIEDFHNTLISFDFLCPEDGLSLDEIFQYLLPYPKETRFDIIFSWDLFNYLERREFLHLARHLTRFCRDGTLIFSLISTKDVIPEQPGVFRILNPERLAYRVSSRIMRECPRYQERDLARLMPAFRVSNSFLLRNGFREYLFTCQK